MLEATECGPIIGLLRRSPCDPDQPWPRKLALKGARYQSAKRHEGALRDGELTHVELLLAEGGTMN